MVGLGEAGYRVCEGRSATRSSASGGGARGGGGGGAGATAERGRGQQHSMAACRRGASATAAPCPPLARPSPLGTYHDRSPPHVDELTLYLHIMQIRQHSRKFPRSPPVKEQCGSTLAKIKGRVAV